MDDDDEIIEISRGEFKAHMMREVSRALLAMWENQVTRGCLTTVGLMQVRAHLNDRDSELVAVPGMNALRRRVNEALANAVPDTPEGLE